MTANTPPASGDVLAEEDHALVAGELLVERRADRLLETRSLASSRFFLSVDDEQRRLLEQRLRRRCRKLRGLGAVDDAVVA